MGWVRHDTTARATSLLGAVAAVAIVGACGTEPTGPRVGTLTVGIDGLPTPGLGDVLVTGPLGYAQRIGRTDALRSLWPGRYTITASRVVAYGTAFDATPPSQTIELGSGSRDSVGVDYRAMTGSIDLHVSAPPTLQPSIHVTGPDGYATLVRRSALLSGLEPGEYKLAADTVTGNGYRYVARAASVQVRASLIPLGVTIGLLPVTGALRLDVLGLPSDPVVVARITGPDGFTQDAVGSTLLGDLRPGSYTVTPAEVDIGGVSWRAPARSTYVGPGVTSAQTLEFLPYDGSGRLMRNVRVQGFTMMQAVQREDNSVPLIAGRDALLRVFLMATTANPDRPTVRARFYRGGTLLDSLTIPAATAVPTNITSNALTGTWDVPVPASLVQPGLGVQVEVDPDRQFAEATRDDNSYPGVAPRAVSVVSGRRPTIVLVPVAQSRTGLTGNATESNRDDLLTFTKRVYPIPGYDASVHEVYTSNAPPLDPQDYNRSWTTILSEVNARRVAEGSEAYYLGIVRVNYGGGIAGVGYIGGRAALSWDREETVASVLAHELGHNFGRYHAPCGGAAFTDPAFPYANGQIGVVGWDGVRGSLLPSTTPDLMSYCHPEWISDYNYLAVLDAIGSAASSAIVGVREEPCLLVWGRIENGRPVLEPAFEIRTRSALPSRPGGQTLRVLDANGGELLALSFEAEQVADIPGSASFAFAIPLSSLRGRRPAELRLVTRAAEARSVSTAPTGAPVADPELSLTRLGARQATVRWNAARYPMAMVRDRRTGEVLSFARGGMVEVRGAELEVLLSDRVGSIVRAP